MAIVWLDSGIIGLIANPHKQGEAEACEGCLLGLAAKGVIYRTLNSQTY
jgi:hypothetical protein